jgi:hypothetical protein
MQALTLRHRWRNGSFLTLLREAIAGQGHRRDMVTVRRTGAHVAAAFRTTLSGLYMRSQGQQIHLGVADEAVLELFERAISSKRCLARIVRGGAAAKAVEWHKH